MLNVMINEGEKVLVLNNIVKKEMNMLKIMVCEGDEVLVLTNVEEMGQDEFDIKVTDCLTEEEQEMICELAFEGIIMTDEDMKEFNKTVRECSFEDYIESLKEFCETCYGDEDC